MCSLSGDKPAYYAGFLCEEVHKRTVPLCRPSVSPSLCATSVTFSLLYSGHRKENKRFYNSKGGKGDEKE